MTKSDDSLFNFALNTSLDLANQATRRARLESKCRRLEKERLALLDQLDKALGSLHLAAEGHYSSLWHNCLISPCADASGLLRSIADGSFYKEEHPGMEVVKACGCGNTFSLDDWRALGLTGVQSFDDTPVRLELRDCSCGSTLGVWIDRYGAVCEGPDNG